MKKLVKRLTSADYVYQILKDRIISGYYNEGDRLKEIQISKDLETSSTPVREALHKLSNERFLEINPYKGVVVKTYTLQDRKEAYMVYGKIHLQYLKWARETNKGNQWEELANLLQHLLIDEDDRHIFTKVQPFYMMLRSFVNSKILESCLINIQAVVNLDSAIKYAQDIETKLEDLYKEVLTGLRLNDYKMVEESFNDIMILSIDSLHISN